MLNDRYLKYSLEELEQKIDYLFNELIDGYFNNQISREDFIFNSYLIISRCENYQLISDKTRKILDCIMVNIFNINDFIDVKNLKEFHEIFFIVINLGLQSCYNHMKMIFKISKKDDYYFDCLFEKYGDDISIYFNNYFRRNK